MRDLEISLPYKIVIVMLFFSFVVYMFPPDKKEIGSNPECTYLEGGYKMNIAMLAIEEGLDYIKSAGCIRKGQLPENIKTFAQWEKSIEDRRVAHETKMREEWQAEEQERKRKLSLTLVQARREFKTNYMHDSRFNIPLPNPPQSLFEKIIYKSDGLSLPAFVTPDPIDGKRHPAIVWLTGGESNTLSTDFWEKQSKSSDESASQYRESGIIMMFPTLRGGNDNLGKIEDNFGEVDDVIAAAKKMSTLPYVDPNQIYLGGHSTGGSLVLLVSEVASQTAPDLFKAVVSYGPALKINWGNDREVDFDYRLRSPEYFLDEIRVPTFVIEGVKELSDVSRLESICKSTRNANLTCLFIKPYNHFSILAPMNSLIADQILLGGNNIRINQAVLNEYNLQVATK